MTQKLNKIITEDPNEPMYWRLHTKSLLSEIITQLESKSYTALHIPIKTFINLLLEVADRAIELNDPELNALMCRLQLYVQADPENKEFDAKLTSETIAEGMAAKERKRVG